MLLLDLSADSVAAVSAALSNVAVIRIQVLLACQMVSSVYFSRKPVDVLHSEHGAFCCVQTVRAVDGTAVFRVSDRRASPLLGRERVDRVLHVWNPALRRRPQRYLDGQQSGTPVGQPAIRPAHKPAGKSVRRVQRVWRGLPQLPPRVPVRLLHQRAPLGPEPHHILHRPAGFSGTGQPAQDDVRGSGSEKDGAHG